MRQYRSLEEKNRYFRENIIIDDINTCVSELTRYNKSHFFFRGVSNASYMIYSSLQRKFVDRVALIPSLSMPEFSREIMSKFRNSAVLTRAFRKEVQSYKSEIAAWAFIQHYGGPSNLIDFTPKLDTALFFATGEGKNIYPLIIRIV
ncbi:MAG: FRG domain-containing protein [Muribaculaceae bacterium]|nr:FRG domain-containing protein [Muribaculaceae bacterium]